MILCFDLGNTRWKWAVYEVDAPQKPYAFGVWSKSELYPDASAHESASVSSVPAVSVLRGLLGELLRELLSELPSELPRELSNASSLRITQILVSSVTEERVQLALEQACKLEVGVSVHFARVLLHCAGVTAAYQQLQNLGVDRWLAFLGAWNKYRSGCVVLDAGSALTADYVSVDGEHAGGLIAPGLGLMEKALFDKTARVKPVNLSVPQQWAPQRDTMPCVEHGLAAMLAGFVREVEQKYPNFLFIVTGGDAALAASYASQKVIVEPFLIFEGLLCYRNALLIGEE
ncbi:Type III pantothenate kinase [Thalassocella blandensis]|nr:Type III pantothenate kinase [Thalassocella blandensis]